MALNVDAPEIDIEPGTPIAWRESETDGVRNRVVITARAEGKCDAELTIGSSRSVLCEPAPLSEILTTVNLTVAMLLGGDKASDGRGHTGAITPEELTQSVGEVRIVGTFEDMFFGDGPGLGFG